MSTITTITRVESAGHRFCELDDLVLRLKGLVLARRYRERIGAGIQELDMYDDEIERLRDQLAALVSTVRLRNDCGNGASPFFRTRLRQERSRATGLRDRQVDPRSRTAARAVPRADQTPLGGVPSDQTRRFGRH